MKAYNLYEAGPASNLKLEEVPTPTALDDDEVLIETNAISINPVDNKSRQVDAFLSSVTNTSDRPVILGWDVAGVVVKIGPGVSDFAVGDKVFGMVNFPGHGKGYAEYVVAKSSHLSKMAGNHSFEEAAATTLAALTALQAMKSRVNSGDTVLIHGGSGGVGHFAIPMAKNVFKAGKVIATSSSKNKEFCVRLGADEHVDYKAGPFEETIGPNAVDFVLDCMGGDHVERSMKVLKAGGRLISLLPSPDDVKERIQEYAKKHQMSVGWSMVKSNGQDMNELREMVEKKQITTHVSKTFPFEQMSKAHEAIDTGHTVGKIVILLAVDYFKVDEKVDG